MRALPRLSESGAQQNLVGTSLAERMKSAELQLRIARGSGVCDDAIDDSVSPREDIMNWTRSFDDVGMTDVALVGGKNASIGAYAALAMLPPPLLIVFATLSHRIMEARHLRGIQRSTAAPAQRRYVVHEAWRNALLVCGIASSLLYALMIWGIRYEGYSLISQVPSELTAIGAPTRALWARLGWIYTVLVAFLGLGSLAPGSPSGIVEFTSTGTVTAPIDGAIATLRAPFDFQGRFFFPGGAPESPSFIGAGTATVTLFRSSNDIPWSFGNSVYEFNEAPVPEPGTLLLVGTALAGLAACRRGVSTL